MRMVWQKFWRMVIGWEKGKGGLVTKGNSWGVVRAGKKHPRGSCLGMGLFIPSVDLHFMYNVAIFIFLQLQNLSLTVVVDGSVLQNLVGLNLKGTLP